MKVAVVGASNKTDRYSYQAVMLLKQKGHEVYPVHPMLPEIEGVKVYKSINQIEDEIDTITIYLNENSSQKISEDILNKNPKRIIFNPGTENLSLQNKAEEKGIKVVKACTLVMLRTGQL